MATALIGFAAAVLTTGCWAPQLVHAWRTRSTRDISWTYLLALTTGVLLWMVYGAMTGSAPVLAANLATASALLTLALFKRTFDRAETR